MNVKKLNEKINISLFRQMINEIIAEIDEYINKNYKILSEINPNIIKIMVKKIEKLLVNLNKLNLKLKKMITDDHTILDFPELKEQVEDGIVRLIKLKRKLKEYTKKIDEIDVEKELIDEIKEKFEDYTNSINNEIKKLAFYFNNNMDELNKKLKKETGVVLTRIKVDAE
jgi:hypothetical protein